LPGSEKILLSPQYLLWADSEGMPPLPPVGTLQNTAGRPCAAIPQGKEELANGLARAICIVLGSNLAASLLGPARNEGGRINSQKCIDGPALDRKHARAWGGGRGSLKSGRGLARVKLVTAERTLIAFSSLSPRPEARQFWRRTVNSTNFRGGCVPMIASPSRSTQPFSVIVIV